MSQKQTPRDFLKLIIGRPVVVKLNSGADYRGIFVIKRLPAGVLISLDGYMNVVLEQTEEYVDGSLKNKYGDTFIRGNNVESFQVAIRASELAAIFVTTFENVRGTVIAYQYPVDYVSPTQFKEISNIVLPRAEFAFRLLTIEAWQHYVIGCPQRIEGDQYMRNTLQFNICLVLKPKVTSVLDDHAHWHFWEGQSAGGLRLPIQAAYEALVLKINRFFYTLEVECSYVSKSLQNTSGDEPLLGLDSIFQQLNRDGSCVLDVAGCGSLYLQFSPVPASPPTQRFIPDTDELVASTHHRNKASFIKSTCSKSWNHVLTSFQPDRQINDECVFVLLAPPEGNQWNPLDHVSRRIMPYLDGRHSLPEVAHLAKVDLTIARLCLSHLIRLGIARALSAPTFLYPASPKFAPFLTPITMAGWVALPRLLLLLKDEELSSACLEAAIVPAQTDFSHVEFHRSSTLVDLFHVLAILCGSPNFSLPHLVSAAPRLKFIDVGVSHQPTLFTPADSSLAVARISLLRLVQFAEVNGLIHRLQCYPIRDSSKLLSTALKKSPDRPAKGQFSPLTVSVNPVWRPMDEKNWFEARSLVMDGLHGVDGIACSAACESRCIFRSANSTFSEEIMMRLYSSSSKDSPLSNSITPHAHQNSGLPPTGRSYQLEKAVSAPEFHLLWR